MKLFRWSSDSLKQYGSGHILVMAETVEEARQKATAAAGPLWRDKVRYYETNWLLQLIDEDDVDDWREFLTKLAADLAKEPTCEPVVFISGSE